ncbi:VOC family protein [Virgibacillus siamensis]|uniref:VOC family protein n=1 Tax=Virgibacillus siamensis TaxID=480071 RepID=UPI000984F978|nr:VOC family protein [Virgibacillus siamensis]
MALRLTPYLMMNGNAKEVIGYYEKALGAEMLGMVTHGEMSTETAEEEKNHVAHALMKIGEAELMVSDCGKNNPSQEGNQVTICITADNVKKSKQVFDALQQGGHVIHPFIETPFSPGFGAVVDKFGVTFQIVTES